MYGFLLVWYSNFVPKSRRFWDIRFQKCRDLENRLSLVNVIENVTIRQSAYDFLLSFHSNHRPISYLFRDRRRFQSKIAKFSHPVYFAPPLKGFPLELGIGAGDLNTRMMLLPGRQRSLAISSDMWIQCTNVPDRRTDGHRATAKTALTHSVARSWSRLTMTTITVTITIWQQRSEAKWRYATHLNIRHFTNTLLTFLSPPTSYLLLFARKAIRTGSAALHDVPHDTQEKFACTPSVI